MKPGFPGYILEDNKMKKTSELNLNQMKTIMGHDSSVCKWQKGRRKGRLKHDESTKQAMANTFL